MYVRGEKKKVFNAEEFIVLVQSMCVYHAMLLLCHNYAVQTVLSIISLLFVLFCARAVFIGPASANRSFSSSPSSSFHSLFCASFAFLSVFAHCSIWLTVIYSHTCTSGSIMNSSLLFMHAHTHLPFNVFMNWSPGVWVVYKRLTLR